MGPFETLVENQAVTEMAADTLYRIGIVDRPVAWVGMIGPDGKPKMYTGNIKHAEVYFGREHAEGAAQRLVNYLVSIDKEDAASRVRCFPKSGGAFTGWMPDGVKKLHFLQR